MNRALPAFAFMVFSVMAFSVFSFVPAAMADKKKAGGGAPKIEIRLPKDLQAKEDAFEKARKKLNRGQKKLIEEMEVNFVSTVDPDLQILQLASDMEACGSDFVNAPDIMKKFNDYRAKKNEHQVVLWGTFDQKYYPQVDFMDHKMLREHLVIKLKVAMNVGAQMIKMRAAQFEKQQQCDKARETLGLESGE